MGARRTSVGTVTRSLRSSYTDVRVLGTQQQRVDRRNALTTSGEAVNAKKVRVRFVNLIVKAKPRNLSITTFTAADADAAVVLSITNAIVSRFEVL